LVTTSSLNEYDPVLGDFTILITLVWFLPEPVWSVATVFFAMTQLFYLPVHSLALQDGVKFLQFQSVGAVLAVLFGNVTRSARLSRLFVLCALHDYLNSISFLCHCCNFSKGLTSVVSFIFGPFYGFVDTYLINCAQCRSGDGQSDPLIFGGYVKTFLDEVGIKSALCSAF